MIWIQLEQTNIRQPYFLTELSKAALKGIVLKTDQNSCQDRQDH